MQYEKQSIGIIVRGTLSLLLAMTALPALAKGNDSAVKKLIFESTGVTDADVSGASGRRELSLFDCYALAVRNTERLAIEGESTLQAEARRIQSIGAFLPKLSLRGSHNLLQQTGIGTIPPRWTIDLYGRQTIVTGLQEIAAITAAQPTLEARRCTLRHQAGLLLLDVARGFYACIQIERSLANNEQVMNLSRKIQFELRRRLAVGRSRQSEVLRSSTQLLQLEANQVALQNLRESARVALASLSGISGDLPALNNAVPADPSYTLEEAKRFVDKRWDVLAAREDVKVANAGFLAAVGGWTPSVYLEGFYSLYKQYYPTKISPGSADSIAYNFYQNQRNAAKHNYSLSLGFELPFFTGGVTYGRVREARSVQRQTELRLSNIVRLATQEVVDAYQTWDRSRREVTAYERALAAATDNYRSVTEDYRLSLVSILDLLTSLTALQNTRDDYERVTLQNRLNRIRLAVAVNEFTGERIKGLRDLAPPGDDKAKAGPLPADSPAR